MESGSAPPPSYQDAPEIPSDIFRPLLAIAQRQYEASDVKQYYLVMLRHLRRMGTMNADAAYTILSPVSDRKSALPGLDGSHIVQTLDDEQVSPKTNLMNEEPTFEPSYEPGQSDQLHIATSAHHYPILNEVSRQIGAELPPALPPRHDSQQFCESPPQDMLMVLPTSTAASEHNAARAVSLPTPPFGTPQQQPYHNPWLSPEQFHASHHLGQQQPRGFMLPFTQPPASYHASIANTLAFHPPPQPQPHPHSQPYPQDQQMYSSESDGFLGPLGTSLGLSQFANNFADEFYSSPLFPMIDVIPSRKRRKALMQKGVRRFTGGIQMGGQGV
ncbi:uncharacterized protein LTR77_004764 [Saxophila tyrrhenica]|uniref:Uncharacterized protein n=1 Tax=Saxophila tyrrhenica TaxID=1690608 RepID=A0AAV9PCE8_9PEZI|nr:hypothetical protein LTR77_004764 [Saxophila tyrrhenica]